MKSDKRRYARIPVDVEFSVRDSTGGPEEVGRLFFAARNVSAGGAFLVSDILFEKGTWLHVRFQLPSLHPIEALALVAWVNEGDDDQAEPGMGIHFSEISRIDLQAIERFVQAEV